MKVLELFAGGRSFSKVANENGHTTWDKDIEPLEGIDLAIDILDFEPNMVGCNPEEEDNELLGCMDPDAANFNPDETFDDGSCGTPCPQLGQEMPELKKKN